MFLKRAAYALTGLLFSGALALATNLPLVPSNPNFSEPSQIQATLNAVIQQLNGNTGYTTASPIVALGTLCQSAASASPNVCNGQRGAASFTGITVAATGTNQTIVVTNSAVSASSICTANFLTAFTAGSAVVVATIVPTAGSLSVVIANAGTTTNAVTTGTLGFSCVN